MRKISLFIIALFACTQVTLAQITVQGIPVSGKMSRNATRSAQMKADSPNAAAFTFADITNWAGEGSNESALVMQWANSGKAIVWGYRWNPGQNPTGWDMIAAIAAEDPRFFTQAEESSYGIMINGFGYDTDSSGDNFYTISNQTFTVPSTGVISQSGTVSIADSEDWWNGGFSFEGYWAYYNGENRQFTGLQYANAGASNRTLTDGSIDAWMFGNGSGSWSALQAAEAGKVFYSDGFFFINEGWLGNENGSINFFPNNGEPQFHVQATANNGNKNLLGTTSCYGTIYGKDFYVVSKQGNRFVKLNAKTLEQKGGTITELPSGDGRAAAVVDGNKVYIGGTNGISVYDIATGTVTGTVAGIPERSQVGDMVCVGKLVFATIQNSGVSVIAAQENAVKTVIPMTDINGLTVAADGNIWAISTDKAICIDPETLTFKETALPGKLGNGWGAWRPASICADTDDPNTLYYVNGGSFGEGGTVSKLKINPDGSLSEDPLFKFEMPAAEDPSQKQNIYATMRIDPHTGYIIIWTVQSGWGNNYSVNRMHLIDPATGAIAKTVNPTNPSLTNKNFWFAEMPVFPDNAMPEIILGDLTMNGAPIIIAAPQVISDADNMASLAQIETEPVSGILTEWTGKNLKILASQPGSYNIKIHANSNGKTTLKSINLKVDVPSGISATKQDNNISIFPTITDSYLSVRGAEEAHVTIYSLSGAVIMSADISDGNVDVSGLAAGAYLVRVEGTTGTATEKIVKR